MTLTANKLCVRYNRTTSANLVRTIVTNGTSQVWWKCEAGHPIDNPRKAIPHEKITAYGITIESIPIDKSYNTVACEVCGKPGTEVHHFAPRHLFGDECEKWPQSNLCKSCHDKWHTIVTPNMSKRNSDGYRKTFNQQVRVGPQNTAR